MKALTLLIALIGAVAAEVFLDERFSDGGKNSLLFSLDVTLVSLGWSFWKRRIANKPNDAQVIFTRDALYYQYLGFKVDLGRTLLLPIAVQVVFVVKPGDRYFKHIKSYQI